MSEENKGVSDAPETSVSDTNLETEKKIVSDDQQNTVQYQTHKKAIAQLKRAQQEREDLAEQLKSLQNEKYEAEGNKDQLIESLRKEVVETKGKLKQTVGSVARSQAMNAIVEEAVKAGCNSPDVVKKFLEDQIAELTFDESFNPDRDEVIELVQRARKTAPILFSKDAPKIANHNLSGGGTANPKPNLKKMSMDELMNTWGDSIKS